MNNKCYICNKKFKEKDEIVNIGKDKDGHELRRHRKCHPGLPKNMKVRKKRF